MTGFVLGVAMLVSSPGVSPAPEMPRIALPPAAITFELPDPERSRWVSRPGSLSRRQASPTRRYSLTERIIATAAGAAAGFYAGAMIGGKITDRSKENPDDDVSVLKGIMIGAPIGAAIGGILGWRLTKN